MDGMIQVYMEETEELLQKAEKCIIELENGYTMTAMNEIFRIVHTIKGSSHMVGFEDLGNFMHTIEDMLYLIRNGNLSFDRNTIDICFDGIDVAFRLLEYKKGPANSEEYDEIGKMITDITSQVQKLTGNEKKSERTATVEEAGQGYIEKLLKQKGTGRFKYYITIILEADAPMKSPVFMMAFVKLDEMGKLEYSSLPADYFERNESNDNETMLEVIINTDFDKKQVLESLMLSYIERINVIDLSREKNQYLDWYPEQGRTEQSESYFVKEMKEIFKTHFLSVYQPKQDAFLSELQTFLQECDDECHKLICLDMERISLIPEAELKELIRLKHKLEDKDKKLVLINSGPYSRRIINIMDSIPPNDACDTYWNLEELVSSIIKSDQAWDFMKSYARGLR